MRLSFGHRFAALGLTLALAACDTPLRPEMTASLAPVLDAKVCADPNDAICDSFSSTVYQYDPSLGALPPGISDWRLVITQFGGQLDFLGGVWHGGGPISDVQNMYLRFFIDNGNNTLGAGDLQIVVLNSPTGATMHCGIVTSLPAGAALPTASPVLCESGGETYNSSGQFVFENFRTVDLSAPLWEAQGFARLRADERRALFLVEVGNVTTSAGVAQLAAATAPASRVDTLSVPTGAGNGGDNGGGTGGGGTDTTAPTISFAGNNGSYGILEQVRISCVATDAGSGIAAATCPTVDALAYTLPLGITTLDASATDNAGNSATASTSFSIRVTADDLCTLARSFADTRGQGTALCATLSSGTRAFSNLVRAQTNKSLSASEAAILLRLVEGLNVSANNSQRCDDDDDRRGRDHRSNERDQNECRDSDRRDRDRKDDDRKGHDHGRRP